jgi:uncharacterized protein YdeI (YjbR/CyaY-like superfamily)
MRAWLEEHHASEDELIVGFHKVGTGRPSLTWSEAVDQALCFGWIDGVRRSVDEGRYTQRFTPRRRGSNWSKVNVDKVEALRKQGLMTAAGLAAYEARRPETTSSYSYERAQAAFTPAMLRTFRADEAAWEFFSAQPPGYRRTATHWVMSAKREETRERRLAQLVTDSAAGRRLAQLTSPSKR